MPLLLGLIVGLFVLSYTWTFIGPFIAILCFLTGRFFLASVIMTVSLYAATHILTDFYVTTAEYQVLLFLGLMLEGFKWSAKLWWNNRREKNQSEQGWEPAQTEVYGDQHASTEYEPAIELTAEEAARFAAYVAQSGGHVTVNVVDDAPAKGMRDVTPRRLRIVK